MKTIAVANQKGGVGKSTTVLNIADGLIHCNYNVLVIDVDPQCNTTSVYGAVIDGENTLYDVMNKNCTAKEAIQKTDFGHIIAGDQKLLEDESKFQTQVGGFQVLRKAIKELENDYDYIIMDTPPNLGIFMLNALTAANGVIIPLRADKFSVDGLSNLLNTIQEVNDNVNPDLEIYGILLTAYDVRTNLDKNTKKNLDDYGKNSGIKIFKPIRVTQTVKDAQAANMSLFEMDSKCNAAEDYAKLVKELLKI